MDAIRKASDVVLVKQHDPRTIFLTLHDALTQEYHPTYGCYDSVKQYL